MLLHSEKKQKNSNQFSPFSPPNIPISEKRVVYSNFVAIVIRDEVGLLNEFNSGFVQFLFLEKILNNIHSRLVQAPNVIK